MTAGFYVYRGAWDPFYYQYRDTYVGYYGGYYRNYYYGNRYYRTRPSHVSSPDAGHGIAPGVYRPGGDGDGARVRIHTGGVVVSAPHSSILVPAPRPGVYRTPPSMGRPIAAPRGPGVGVSVGPPRSPGVIVATPRGPGVVVSPPSAPAPRPSVVVPAPRPSVVVPAPRPVYQPPPQRPSVVVPAPQPRPTYQAPPPQRPTYQPPPQQRPTYQPPPQQRPTYSPPPQQRPTYSPPPSRAPCGPVSVSAGVGAERPAPSLIVFEPSLSLTPTGSDYGASTAPISTPPATRTTL